ncbi:hypothetical protein [Corynebacterium silvaticum]|nr:hypothetical protein [Corynebacterium silvaticum]MBH5300121.1 hypothetical protein [Corynebacterium silvaticum]NOM65878.1 hypothetical protein [Corynebacterium silvaticum]
MIIVRGKYVMWTHNEKVEMYDSSRVEGAWGCAGGCARLARVGTQVQ